VAHGFCLVGFALLLLFTRTFAAAADEREQDIAFYRATWAGLPAAKIRFELDEMGAGYRAEIAIETEGLARWLSRFRADATVEGRLERDGTAQPERYDARYDLRKWHARRVDMRFVAGSSAVVAERGKDDTSRKPELAESFRRNVLDPISAVTVIRETLRHQPPEPGQEFTVAVYDGARRFDVATRIVPSRGKDRLIHLRLMLRPLAGFKGESSDEGDPDDAPRPADVTLTDDGRYLIASLTVPVVFLPFTVRLDHRCASFADCGDTKP
jgi:hypothetical protein